MPHLRLNEKAVSPNPYFNFISALPVGKNTARIPTHEDAKGLLNALAAQVRPICKKHGFTVNSFEEYEHNTVFLGRNWNAGETIEIVLRRSDGRFYGTQQLIQVVCHELAHIKHMNHGIGFQQMNAQLCSEVAVLRSNGYFGDGMYSSGIRLGDSIQVSGNGLGQAGEDLPEYLCGGAQQRQKASTLGRKHRQRAPQAPTAKRRKPGTRVASKYAFEGDGQALNSHITDESEKKKGIGFRRSTRSAKERDARLKAIEKRLQTLQDPGSESAEIIALDESESESEGFEETDTSRQKLLTDAGVGWKFHSTIGTPEIDEGSDDILTLISDDESVGVKTDTSTSMPGTSSLKPKKQTALLTSMLRTEIQHHKRERLGLVGTHRLGASKPLTIGSQSLGARQPDSNRHNSSGGEAKSKEMQHTASDEWACLVCTCLNHDDYGVCQACNTRRGQTQVTA